MVGYVSEFSLLRCSEITLQKQRHKRAQFHLVLRAIQLLLSIATPICLFGHYVALRAGMLTLLLAGQSDPA
jgi:hypothetical protein